MIFLQGIALKQIVYVFAWVLILVTPVFEGYVSHQENGLVKNPIVLTLYGLVAGLLCAFSEPLLYRSLLLAISLFYYHFAVHQLGLALYRVNRYDSKCAVNNFMNLLVWFTLYVVLR